jgi:glycerol-3-phosphate dehydrogenase
MVAFDRNRNVAPALRLPAGRVVSRDHAIQRYPGLRRQGLTGAAVWHDYVTTEADRLTFAWALAAAQHGAVLANHVEARGPILDARRVTGMAAVDRLSGRDLEISARMTVNASGSGIERLVAPIGASTRAPLLKAMNLVTTRDAGDEALGGQSASGRRLFLVPWRGRALFGTWESVRPVRSGDARVEEADVASFIADLNHAFPSLDLTLEDISLVHRGAVPARAEADGRVSLQGRERVSEDADGLMSVAGTKYTTARRVAEDVTDRLLRKLQRPPVPCRTAAAALPGGDLRDVALTIAEARRDYDAGLPSDTVPHLVEAYGSQYRDVLRLADDRPDLRTRVGKGSPVIGAEIVWAARHEMALTLADAVIRRTPLGALGFPGEEALQRAAEIMQVELGWSDDRKRQETEAVRKFYQFPIRGS